mmetsp:Transcript_17123/g.35160  ORF Transcript_17123/g.35160 Transcript_17123/m.35160 type:complete len:83 (-) Transcript_17123:1177-1425(-)
MEEHLASHYVDLAGSPTTTSLRKACLFNQQYWIYIERFEMKKQLVFYTLLKLIGNSAITFFLASSSAIDWFATNQSTRSLAR